MPMAKVIEDVWLTTETGDVDRWQAAKLTGGVRSTVKVDDGDRWLTASDGSLLQSQRSVTGGAMPTVKVPLVHRRTVPQSRVRRPLCDDRLV